MAPIYLIAMLVWVDRGLPRPRSAAAIAALVAGALPGVLPYSQLIDANSVAGALAFLPLMRLQEDVLTPTDIPYVVVLGAIAVAILMLVLPRRLALAAPALVLLYFAVVQIHVEHYTSQASRISQRVGLSVKPAWIDEAVGPDADVAAIWTGDANFLVLWENEFFNRAVGPVYNFTGAPDGLPQETLSVDPASGILRDPAGMELRSRYVVIDPTTKLKGRVLSGPWPAGGVMNLYEASQPVTVQERTQGLYTDGWSDSLIVYTRYGCKGGVLSVILIGSSELRPKPARVIARSEGRVVAQTLVGDAAQSFRVPLGSAGGACEAELDRLAGCCPGRRFRCARLTCGRHPAARSPGTRFHLCRVRLTPCPSRPRLHTRSAAADPVRGARSRPGKACVRSRSRPFCRAERPPRGTAGHSGGGRSRRS